MARNPITWQTVVAPNFTDSAINMRTAAESLNRGFDAFDRGIERFSTTNRENSDAAGQLAALRYQDPVALRAAMENGTFAPGLNMSGMSAAGIARLGERPGQLIQNDTTQQSLDTARIRDPIITNNTRLTGESLAAGTAETRQRTGFAAELQPGVRTLQGQNITLGDQRITDGRIATDQTLWSNNQTRTTAADTAEARRVYEEYRANGATDWETSQHLLRNDPNLANYSPGMRQQLLGLIRAGTPQGNAAPSMQLPALPAGGPAASTALPASMSPGALLASIRAAGGASNPSASARVGATARAALDPNSPTYLVDLAAINDTVVRGTAGNIGGSRPGPNADVPNWDRGIRAPNGATRPVDEIAIAAPGTPPAAATAAGEVVATPAAPEGRNPTERIAAAVAPGAALAPLTSEQIRRQVQEQGNLHDRAVEQIDTRLSQDNANDPLLAPSPDAGSATGFNATALGVANRNQTQLSDENLASAATRDMFRGMNPRAIRREMQRVRDDARDADGKHTLTEQAALLIASRHLEAVPWTNRLISDIVPGAASRLNITEPGQQFQVNRSAASAYARNVANGTVRTNLDGSTTRSEMRGSLVAAQMAVTTTSARLDQAVSSGASPSIVAERLRARDAALAQQQALFSQINGNAQFRPRDNIPTVAPTRTREQIAEAASQELRRRVDVREAETSRQASVENERRALSSYLRSLREPR